MASFTLPCVIMDWTYSVYIDKRCNQSKVLVNIITVSYIHVPLKEVPNCVAKRKYDANRKLTTRFPMVKFCN